MKKIIKRILMILILIILLFEFSFSNSLISYAVEEDGTVIDLQTRETITGVGGGIISIILWIPKFIVTGLTWLINKAVGVVASMENTTSAGTITPYKIFFNKYDLLKVNMFDFGSNSNSFNYKLRETIATWYYAMQLFASAILLVVLIYVGIRMAIASVAEDKAKYKKMLIDWVVGFALIFVLHYMAIFIIYCNDAIVNAIRIAYETVGDGDNAEAMIDAIFMKAFVGVGLTADAAMIVYIGIVFQTIFFLLAYINRMLKVGFLLVISPLITLTYSIDKIGDGKAQALGTWLKEFIYTILIQPFHCIIYFSFISIAFKLVIGNNTGAFSYKQLAAGVLAILCIKFINDGESIVRKIFGFQDDNSKTSMAAGAMVAIAAAKSTSNAISKTKVGFNKAASFGSKLKKDFAKDAPEAKQIIANTALGRKATELGNKFNNSAAGRFAGKVGDKAGELGSAIGNKVDDIKNSKFGQGVSKLSSGAKKGISGAKSKVGKFKQSKAGHIADFATRKTLSTSAAIMAFAATYATGNTDALSAIGYGSAAAKGMNKAFDSSSSRNESDASANLSEADEENKKVLEQRAESLEKNAEQMEGLVDKFDEVQEAMEEADGYDKDASSENKKADEEEEKADKEDKLAKQNEEQAKKYREQIDAAKTKSKRDELKKKAEEQEREALLHRRREENYRNIAKKHREKADSSSSQAETLRESIMQKDPDGILAKRIKAKKTKKDFIQEVNAKRDEAALLRDELAHYYDEDKIKDRLEIMKGSVGSKEVKDKANEIEKLIQEIIAQSHTLTGEEVDPEGELVTIDDMNDGKNINGYLQNLLKQDQISHSNMSTDKILEEIGLDQLISAGGEGSQLKDLSEQLRIAISEQKINYRLVAFDENKKNDKAMGISSERFSARVDEMAIRQIQSRGKKGQ